MPNSTQKPTKLRTLGSLEWGKYYAEIWLVIVHDVYKPDGAHEVCKMKT
jgi:hypothetical protein